MKCLIFLQPTFLNNGIQPPKVITDELKLKESVVKVCPKEISEVILQSIVLLKVSTTWCQLPEQRVHCEIINVQSSKHIWYEIACEVKDAFLKCYVHGSIAKLKNFI